MDFVTLRKYQNLPAHKQHLLVIHVTLEIDSPVEMVSKAHIERINDCAELENVS